MVIKNYSVTLEEEIVKEALEKVKKYGGKLSTLINELLKNWIENGGKKK